MDSCEYLLRVSFYQGYLAHKGNCRFCKERRQKELKELVSKLNKIKSFNPQTTWKPSDEQMEALDDVIDEYDGYPEFDSLVSLKNDLKKLREK